MGLGIAVFLLCILVAAPVMIASGFYLYRFRRDAATELENFAKTGRRARWIRVEIYLAYGVLLALFYSEFWTTVLAKITGFDDDPGLIYRVLTGVMSWDNLSDILIYLAVLGCGLLLITLVDVASGRGTGLYKTNRYVALVYLVGLYPFVILSFIGWAASWEPQKRFYQSDEILANFGFASEALEQQLGADRVDVLQSILSWSDTNDIPVEWIPRNLARLDQLKRLSFHTCPVTPLELTPELGELDSLTSITIVQCKVEKIPPTVFALANLRALNLSRNSLDELPGGIENLVNLEVLDLRGNRLDQLSEDIGDLVRLRELKLSGNRISVLPDSTAKLTNLTTLYLSHNELTEIPDFIGNLPQLEMLDISNNRITRVPESVLELLRKKQLRYFSFSPNPLSDEEIKRIESSVDEAFTSYYWNRL